MANKGRTTAWRKCKASVTGFLLLGQFALAQDRYFPPPISVLRLDTPALTVQPTGGLGKRVFEAAIAGSDETSSVPQTARSLPPPAVLGMPVLVAPARPVELLALPLTQAKTRIRPTASAQGKDAAQRPRPIESGEDQPILVTIKIDPPGSSELFRLESEAHWRERMRRDARQNYPFTRLDFPESGRPSALENTMAREWPLRMQLVEPNYLCYRRLFFEDINTERYGWDLGVLQPFASVGSFYWNLGALPLRLLATPVRNYECNGGYYLPGDPVPYMIYPPLR